MGNSNDDNTVCLLRRKPQHIGKIQVKCNHTSLLCTTNFIEPMVRAALELLVPNSQNVVAMGQEYLLRPCTEILIQLELHPAATSTNRSRDISAP